MATENHLCNGTKTGRSVIKWLSGNYSVQDWSSPLTKEGEESQSFRDFTDEETEQIWWYCLWYWRAISRGLIQDTKTKQSKLLKTPNHQTHNEKISNRVNHWRVLIFLQGIFGHLCTVVDVSLKINLLVCRWQDLKAKNFCCGLACKLQSQESKRETENLHALHFTHSSTLLLKIIQCCSREIYQNNKFFNFPWNSLKKTTFSVFVGHYIWHQLWLWQKDLGRRNNFHLKWELLIFG